MSVFYYASDSVGQIFGSEYLTLIFVANLVVKNASLALTETVFRKCSPIETYSRSLSGTEVTGGACPQVVVVVRRGQQSMLTQSAVAYLAAHPLSGRSWRGMLVFGSALTLLTLVPLLLAAKDIWSDRQRAPWSEAILCGLDIWPTTVLSLLGDTFLAIMSAEMFSAAEIADAVLLETNRILENDAVVARRPTENVGLDPVHPFGFLGSGDALKVRPTANMSVQPEGVLDVPEAAARVAAALRALRVRQQLIHDMVLVTNSVFAWPNLCWMVVTVLESSVCFYVALAYWRENGTREMSPVASVPSIMFGVALSARYSILCMMGQRLRDQAKGLS
ncbi:hypothetical protein ONE63_011226 [Megalurothrips usitatus]|uniref:Gustatory receptor n=1 Tax=Megalurothrips usitatus TaxID=439358 RepID=A0AAV7X2E8_9NEOP|nr:hypothetical protein ONE63_011226 [Megalurothrips usitatus]